MNKPNKSQRTFYANVFGMQIKIFRTGRFLRVPTERNFSDPHLLKTLHSHFTHEIFFVTDGALELITEDGTETFERKVVILRPRIKHYSTPNGGECFCLLFSVEAGRKGHRPSVFQKTLETSRDNGVICDFPITEELAFYVRKLSEKCDDGTSDSEAELLVSLIFHEIVRELSPPKELLLASHTESVHINEIERYINSHFLHKLTLADVADHVYLSTRQVARILQKEYGCTLAELLIEKRLAVAEMLLKNTDMKVCDIAKQSGIGSENYFYPLFKRQYGMSPLRFRSKYKK